MAGQTDGPIRALRRGKLHPTVTDPAVEPNVRLRVLDQRLCCRQENQKVRRLSSRQRQLSTVGSALLTSHRSVPVAAQRLLQDTQRSALPDRPESSQEIPDRPPRDLRQDQTGRTSSPLRTARPALSDTVETDRRKDSPRSCPAGSWQGRGSA